MSKPLILSDNFSDLTGKPYFPVVLSIIFIGVLTGLILLSTMGELTEIAFAILAVIPLLYLMVRYPRVWIYIIALTNIYFFYEREKGVSTIELILTALYYGTLAIWFFWELFVKREKLIHNIADYFILFFLVIILINFSISYLNANDLFLWSREAAVFFLLIIYFPIRKYFTEKKHLVTLICIYAIVVAALAFLHFYTYMQFLEGKLEYAYQLMRGIKVNQTLFGSAAVFGFVYALYNKNKIIKILLILFTCISISGLITSFSRTLWVILVVQLFVVIFYLTGRQRINLMIYSLITALLLTGSIFFVFRDKSQVMLMVIENRFISTKRGTQDISIKGRFAEYEQVWKEIKESPLAGNGLAKKFTFWNILDAVTARESYIHNGFLFIMHKLGIPALFVFLFPVLYFIVKGERLARKSDDEFYRLLCVGSFMALILIIISNFTASQVMHRESSFITALSFAFIAIVMEKKKVLTISSKQLTDKGQQKTDNR